MLNHLCWLCKGNTGHQLVGEARFVGPEAGVRPQKLACAAYECSVCRGISVALFPFRNAATLSVPLHQFVNTVRGDELRWRPSVTETQDYPDVPVHIAEAGLRPAEWCTSRS